MAINFEYLEKLVGGKESSMSFDDAAEFFGAKGLRYELEERVGILMFDGELDRDASEIQAVREMFQRYNADT